MDVNIIMTIIASVVLIASIVVILRGTLSTQSRTTKTIVCPNTNCNYRGECRQVSRSVPAVIVLTLVFFPLAILYCIVTPNKYFCPNCGLQIGADY